MPYNQNNELPESVTNVLPSHAQDIYRKSFNDAWDEYENSEKRRGDESQEEAAHRVAWQAVKQKYEKGEDDKWHPNA
jgi:cation transport regulator